MKVAIERLIHEKYQCIDKIINSLFKITNSLRITDYDDQNVEHKGWISKKYFNEIFEGLNSTLSFSPFGYIISSLLKYISNFIEKQNLTNEKSDHLNYAVMKLLKYFPIDCLNVLKIINEDLVDKSFKSIIKFANSDKVAEFAISYYGPQKAIETIPDKVLCLASKSYRVASEIAPYVNQPLQQMPTFMAFQNEEKHKEWIEQCKLSIHKERWVLPKEEIIIKKIKEESSERKFIFNDAKALKGIDNLFDGTLISLINFFYFSTKEIQYPLKDIESFILESNDLRLIIGFFYYSINHEYKTQRIIEWSNKLVTLYKNNDFSIYSVSLFLFSIKSKIAGLPKELYNLIRNVLFSFGYYIFSIPFLNYLYNTEKGMKLLFIYSIISLDIESFNDYPLIKIKFTNDNDEIFELYKQYFSKQNQSKLSDLILLCRSISSVYFKPKEEELIQYQNYPIINSSMLSLNYNRLSSNQKILKSDFIDLFLDYLSKQKIFPPQLFDLLTNISMSAKQYNFLYQFIKPNLEEAKHYFYFLFPSSRLEQYQNIFISPALASLIYILPPSQ